MPVATGVRIRADLALNVRRREWQSKFDKMTDDAKAGLRLAVQRNTLRLVMHAKALAPVQKGVSPTATLRNAIQHIFFDDGMTGSVYVGRMVEPRTIARMDIRTRKAYGKARPKQMPIYVEFGTVQSGERPFLLPALRRFYPQFEADCHAAINRAMGD